MFGPGKDPRRLGSGPLGGATASQRLTGETAAHKSQDPLTSQSTVSMIPHRPLTSCSKKSLATKSGQIVRLPNRDIDRQRIRG